MIIGDCNVNGSWYPDRVQTIGIELEYYSESTDRYIMNIDNMATQTDPSTGVQSGIDIAAVLSKLIPYAT